MRVSNKNTYGLLYTMSCGRVFPFFFSCRNFSGQRTGQVSQGLGLGFGFGLGFGIGFMAFYAKNVLAVLEPHAVHTVCRCFFFP